MADTESSSPADSALSALKRWYHIPVLAAVVAFMFWTRFQNYSAFQRDDGVWLQAVDSWYHWRTTNWMVENYPSFMGFDPWTGFPDGTFAGQFGTVFDFIVATVALIIGVGTPGESDVLLAALVTVPALAALVAIPTYYLGKEIGTRIGGLAGVAVLALFTGQFFSRSTAGQFQHHAAEVLFMAIAVLAIVLAVTRAETEKPIWELVAGRELAALRPTIVYSALAGVAMTLYLFVWPPGIVLVGIFGVYLVLQLCIDYLRGRPPEHIAFVGVISMSVVAVGTAARIQEPGFSATGLDYLPPVFALLVAGGAVFMAALARQWDARQLDTRGYPAAVALSIVASLVALAVVLPGLFDTLIGNISGRLVPFGHDASALTVQEVDPPSEFFTEFVQNEYGWAFYTGVLAIPILAVQSVLKPEHRAKYLFILVWAIILISMGMTQVRFNYYLALGVAVLNAHLVGVLTAGMSLPGSVDELEEQVSGVQVYQVIGVVIVAMLLFVPLLPPAADTTPVSAGDQTGVHGDTITWDESNQWLAENTPEMGNYGGAGNTDALDYMGTYGWPAGGSFDYEEGTYGVLSWWDYGHLITARSERIPHSNPFQQNAVSSSAFLTAQSEQQAELYLDAIAAGEDVSHDSDEDELREVVGDGTDDAGIQYVMVDDASAADKFPAITAWTGPEFEEYVEDAQIQVGGQEQTGAVGGAYYDTMTSQLYLDDAEGLEHYRLIHEASEFSMLGFVGQGTNVAMLSQPIGGWENPPQLTEDEVANMGEFAEQLEQFRAQNVAIPLGETQLHDTHVASSLKTFERVDGAAITGQTESGETVEASVELQTGTERTFTYTQSANVSADGTFELTVPYPTEETLGTEDGYADSSVLATGEYDIVALDEGEAVRELSNISVPERDVQEGATVTVGELEEIPAESELSNLDIAGQGSEANITAGDAEDIHVDVENVGVESGSFDVTLELGEERQETATTEQLDGGEIETIRFENATADLEPDEYTITVVTDDDVIVGQLIVEEPTENGENGENGEDSENGDEGTDDENGDEGADGENGDEGTDGENGEDGSDET